MRKQIKINGYDFEINFLFIGTGKNPKCYSFINGKKWVSVNSYNVKKYPTYEMDVIIEELRFGAYKMFL